MVQKKRKIREKMQALSFLLAMVLAIFASMSSAQAASNDGTYIRPIEDFVEKQGTYCVDDPSNSGNCLFPPEENFITWTAYAQERGISVDYAGLESKLLENEGISLGTTTDGTITERPLADGRAEVTVLLHTNNALTYAIKLDPTIQFDPTNLETYQFLFPDNRLFGYNRGEVSNGKEAALGESFLKLVFINTALGADIPDIPQLAFFPEDGQQLISVIFSAQADGALREKFGVPEGTPGRVQVIQTGLFMTKFKGATGDGFPAERINIKKVGQTP